MCLAAWLTTTRIYRKTSLLKSHLIRPRISEQVGNFGALVQFQHERQLWALLKRSKVPMRLPKKTAIAQVLVGFSAGTGPIQDYAT